MNWKGIFLIDISTKVCKALVKYLNDMKSALNPWNFLAWPFKVLAVPSCWICLLWRYICVWSTAAWCASRDGNQWYPFSTLLAWGQDIALCVVFLEKCHGNSWTRQLRILRRVTVFLTDLNRLSSIANSLENICAASWRHNPCCLLHSADGGTVRAVL